MPLRVDVPITYTTANGKVVHSPMVDAVIGGVPTLVVVDTGASDHVLTIELARRIGLPLEPCEPGTDVEGASVPSWSAGDVDMVLGGTSVPLREATAIDGPPPFARWGIGGIVSPQRLHPSGVVVLDLHADVLTIADSAAPVPGPAGSWHVVDLRRHASGMLCTDAMFLDSGAPDTMEGVAAPQGSTPDDAPTGLIGMDAMKGTVVVIGPADGGAVQWYVRRPPPAP